MLLAAAAHWYILIIHVYEYFSTLALKQHYIPPIINQSLQSQPVTYTPFIGLGILKVKHNICQAILFHSLTLTPKATSNI